MISEVDFAELGDSLSTGFFADKVIMALTRTQRIGQLQDQDRPTIQNALELFKRILNGGKWLDNRRFTTESAESAVAFDRAVTALSIPISTSMDFNQYIERLEQSTDTLLTQNTVEAEELKRLRHFFTDYGRRVFAEAEDVIERSGTPQGLHLWTQRPQETI